MRQQLSKHISFFSRSLLWSLLLYAITILLLDWTDIKTGLLNGDNEAHIVSNTMPDQQTPRKG